MKSAFVRKSYKYDNREKTLKKQVVYAPFVLEQACKKGKYMRRMKCAGCRKVNCNGCSLYPGKEFNTNKKNQAVLPASFLWEEKKSGYGLVYDLGTTTIAAMLWNLDTGRREGAFAGVNPQRKAGSDVVSRITYALKSPEKAKELQRLVVNVMDEMAKQLYPSVEAEAADAVSQECPADERQQRERTVGISEVVVTGNTAMCELLLGLSVEGLSCAPFAKAYHGCEQRKGKEIGLAFLKDAAVTVLPSIGGYVGADALSVYTYLKMIEKRDKILAVDIGTNGEILLWKEDKVYACSAPAGPALEGAAVKQGMGALAGAIEEVKLSGIFPKEDICCKIIGNTAPMGICGSGLVDALALLKREGIIDRTGYLKSQTEARKSGVRERLCQRIFEIDGERQVLLTDETAPVYLTAGDIRQLQLAKGAVRAAVQMLLEKAQLKTEEVTHCYLAGAFGSYIRIESAMEIGLLPAFDAKKVTHTGNCASLGAAMALFSDEVRRQMEEAAERIIHVELAEEKAFEEYFMTYMDM